MTPETWRKVQQLFQDALQLQGRERSDLLDRVCANDASLRAEVEKLLRADERAGGFIEDAIDLAA